MAEPLGPAGSQRHWAGPCNKVPDAPGSLREVPAVKLLRRVWIQNFLLPPAKAGEEQGVGGPGEDGTLVRWRTPVEGFPTSLQMVASPYDPEVHYAKKRSTTWIGYKVYRGRYRVACQAMDLISVDLFEGAGVLAAVKDKALARGPAALLDLRCARRPAALLDLRCARRPAQCQIGTAE